MREGLIKEAAIVLVNDKGNPAQVVNAITSFGKSFKAISGTQDPTTNNGATTTTVSLASRDARIGFLV
jgi:hypothetical protein